MTNIFAGCKVQPQEILFSCTSCFQLARSYFSPCEVKSVTIKRSGVQPQRGVTAQTCSKWLLSAYPLTNNQYRVVEKLGPGRSSMPFSFPASAVGSKFRFFLLSSAAEDQDRSSTPGRTDSNVRAKSAAGRRAPPAAAEVPMVRSVEQLQSRVLRVDKRVPERHLLRLCYSRTILRMCQQSHHLF